MKKLYSILIAACCAALLTGCEKDDESAFIGQDNYITSFKLALGENGFSALISGDSLIVHTVEGRELNGATATVSISENAKIYPDPAAVSDWDNAHSFVVTSFNGKQRIYQYAVKREKAEAVKKGNFTLTTQTEVDDFGTLGIEVLEGNLTIGVARTSMEVVEEEDPIKTLLPLETLQEVKGTITFYTFGSSDLTGLDNLRQVGSISVPLNYTGLKSFILPELQTVLGSISIPGVTNAMSLRTVYMPKLTSVEGDMVFEGMQNISSFLVPELRTVLGNISLGGNGGTNNLDVLSFPKLEEIGGRLSLYQFTGKNIDCPELVRCGGFAWEQTGATIETLTFPKLEELSGSSTLGSNFMQLKKISFPVLSYIEAIELRSMNSLKEIDMPKLKQVNNLSLGYMPALENLNCLGTLEAVNGILRLEYLTGLAEPFAIPSTLTTLNGLAISNMPGVTELDLRGTGIKDIEINNSTSSDRFKLSADDVVEGSLTLNGLFELTGMKEVKGDVTISMPNTTETVDLLSNTEAVRGNFTLTYNATTGGINLPVLASVGGACTLKVKAPVAAPKLKTVGKGLTYDKGGVDNGTVAEFFLPELESVGGDFFIYTGHVTSCPPNPSSPVAQGTPFEIKMPVLTTIGGLLKIHTNELAFTSTRGSNRLADLDGFASLTSVKGVDIYRQAALRSFEGLRNAIHSFTADDWQVQQTGYMPSYDDLAEGGKYIDPTL